MTTPDRGTIRRALHALTIGPGGLARCAHGRDSSECDYHAALLVDEYDRQLRNNAARGSNSEHPQVPTEAVVLLDGGRLEVAIRDELESLWGEPTEPAMRRAVVKGIAQRYAAPPGRGRSTTRGMRP